MENQTATMNGSTNREQADYEYNVGTINVAVEGNIGSGKTTFLDYCAGRKNLTVHPEPIEKWRNVRGENLLAKLYEDPHRWGFTFQLHAATTVMEIYHRRTGMPLKIIERSLWSSRHCFLEQMKQTRAMSDLEGNILENWYDMALSDHKSRPRFIVYLRTDPIVTYHRMIARGRGEEMAVSLDYLKAIHQRHEEWIEKVRVAEMIGQSDVPVYTIDANFSGGPLIAQYETCMQILDMLALDT